ncbi:hypothetical protein [Bifidobacterium longum]
MRDFIFHNPVKIYFGKGQARHIAQEVERVEGAVLVVYGGGSIKRNGAYDDVMAAWQEPGAKSSSCPALRRTRDWTKRWKAYDWSRSMASA